MEYLPLFLNTDKLNILIVGGGKSALLKAKGIAKFTKQITFLSPCFSDEVIDFGCKLIYKKYEIGDLNGFDLVYACTDNSDTNQQIKNDCSETHTLALIADNPKISDFKAAAVLKNEKITIAVSTHSNDPKYSIKVRDRIAKLIEDGILEI